MVGWGGGWRERGVCRGFRAVGWLAGWGTWDALVEGMWL